MRLTRRGVAVALASLVSYAGGLWAGYPLFRGLGGAGIGIVLIALLYAVRQPRVLLEREVHPDRIERGNPALATLRVRNSTTRRQPAFVAVDRIGSHRRPVPIRSVPAGGEARYHYELPTERRGLIPIGPLRLERADPLGLARGGRAGTEQAVLWVHPRRHPVRTVRGSHPRHHHEGRTADESLRGSADLRDVREYVVGDEVRHLHWKATARTGQLMVRDYVDPDQPRMTVLLDDRSGAFPGELFEEAVEVAASLLYDAAMAGHVTRLITATGVDQTTPGGPAAARQLLDALCQLEPSADTGTHLVPRVLTATRSVSGGIVVVASATASPQVAELAILRDRHPVFALILLGPAASSDRAPGLRTIPAPDAASATHTWNLLAAR